MRAKTLSLNQLRANAAQFVVEWADAPGDERQEAQSFVADLLAAFGITRRRAALYERRAKRSSTGGHGYIDALVPGTCVIEMKSAGKDLEAAEDQALDYLNDLTDAEFPQWILTSDFKRFRLTDLLGRETIEFPLTELPQHVEDLQFLAGYQVRQYGDQAQAAATVKAAGIMADLYEMLATAGYPEHDAGIFLVRLLFALYADDAGVWERGLFEEYIRERTSEDGSDVGGQIANFFQVVNKPENTRQVTQDEMVQRFPYVNGGIFAGAIEIAAFNKQMRDRLLIACGFNWASISPAIFGSLFQAVKDPKARRELGEHYTTEENILKTINPLFMDALNERLEKNWHSIPGLKRLRTDIGKMRFLDPACGSGNFLVIAYREMRALDLKILTRMQELGDTSEIPALFFTKDDLPVTLDHFAGIEIEEWPARIAQTALHLADHQANQQMELALGKAPEPLPLDKVDTIHVGNALRMPWESIFEPSPDVYIMGNPPFIGQYLKDTDQRADLQLVWADQYDGYLDYVTGWYKKAADYFRHCVAGQFAFVSTNSIAQGQPVRALFKPLFDVGWHISFAHQTFAWSSEAPGMARVHAVVIGFVKGRDVSPRLFTYPNIKAQPIEVPANRINAYLVDAPNLWVGKRTKPLAPLPAVNKGSQPTDNGNLLVGPNEYDEVYSDAIARKYLRPFIGAKQMISNSPRWCLWLEDADPSDLKRSPMLRSRVEANRLFREKAPKNGDAYKLRQTPHLMRPNRSRPETPYICIPRHFSEHRNYATVAYYEPDVIAGDANFTAVDPDGFMFGIISSSMFITWQRMVGGRIKSDPRFSKDLVWNNLPLPEVPEKLRRKIIDAGKGIMEVRERHPERSLADHYDPLAMDPALVAAHNTLDRYVDKAFGATRALATNEERQVVLLQRYQEMTA